MHTHTHTHTHSDSVSMGGDTYKNERKSSIVTAAFVYYTVY